MITRLRDGELLAKLVGFDSTSRHSNIPIADFICNYLDRPGVRIEREPSADGQKANLVITLGPDGQGGDAGLVLSGHMDVVPADEPDWCSDPFTLVERDGQYVGRGVCDMKGFLALATNAAAAADLSVLRKPLVLLFTYDEELGTVGARRFAETRHNGARLPRSVIVGEPTSLKVVRAHKGHVFMRVGLSGTSAHSAYPHLGENAIEPAARVVTALAGLGQALERERPPSSGLFPEVPYSCLSVTQIEGGSAVNVIPDRCEVGLSARLLPGVHSDDLVRRIRAAIGEVLGDTPYQFDVVSESPPLLLDEGAEIYRRLCAEVAQRDSHSASYTTDAGWFQTLGLDCAVFGPGTIDVAHKPNESLPVSEFGTAAGILGRIIHLSCESAD